MSQAAIPLESIIIDVPCNASWDEMIGTDRVRFCGHCRLHVYNLSEMSRPEAEDLLRQSHERLCVRLYRRPDGTVITRDCRKAIERLANKVVLLACMGIAWFLFVLCWSFGTFKDSLDENGRINLRRTRRIGSVLNWLAPAPPRFQVDMGKKDCWEDRRPADPQDNLRPIAADPPPP